MIIVFICMAKGVKLSVSGGFETLGMHDIVIVRSSEGSARPEGAEEIVLMKPVACACSREVRDRHVGHPLSLVESIGAS